MQIFETRRNSRKVHRKQWYELCDPIELAYSRVYSRRTLKDDNRSRNILDR